MAANKKPGLLEQNRAKSNKHDERITQEQQAVKGANWLKDFHVRSGLSGAEMVELIRPLCSGFDKALLAKCENLEKYGIQISAKAMNHLKRWERRKKHERSTGCSLDP